MFFFNSIAIQKYKTNTMFVRKHEIKVAFSLKKEAWFGATIWTKPLKKTGKFKALIGRDVCDAHVDFDIFIYSIQHGPFQSIFAAIRLTEKAKNEILLSTKGQRHGGQCLIEARKNDKNFIKSLHFFFQKNVEILKIDCLCCESTQKRSNFRNSSLET